MKRLLIIAALVSAAFAGFAPVQAQEAYPTEGTPILFTCTGTGGYEDTASGPVYNIQSHRAQVPTPVGVSVGGTTCKAWSPDTAQVPTFPEVPSDPTDPTEWLDNVIYWGFYQSTWWSPVAAFGNMDGINLVGDFSCGSGTLSSPAAGARFNYANVALWSIQYWTLEDDFTVTFSDGVGQASGTARHEVTGEVRDVSGTIAIDDGAAIGQCDDSAGAADLAVALVLTPKN